MAKFQPWLKMWVEWIDDPKMLSLSLAEQGVWWRLVTLAKKCAADGSIVKGHGTPLSLAQIVDTIRIKTKADRKVFDSMVEKMTDQGSLHWNDDTLVITNFKVRQAKTTSETPEAVRERVRLHRQRKAGVTENPLRPTPTTVKDIYIDTEVDVEVTSLHSVTRNGKPVTPEAVLAEIAKLHEENFGILTPLLAEKFKDFAENYHGPIDWIKEAFAEAVTNNVRKWAYVEKILDTWQQEGRKTHGARKQRKDTRDEAHRQGDEEPSAERYRQSLER
ncbi:MAG TPA: DnaD domain protein [Dehalococcoidia bacterium]|nr:DnaD domain protein [Dehalococcoidia bacterium]